MKKTLIWGILFALLSTAVLAAELQDTAIDYTNYREVAAGDAGILYKIKIINLGDTTRTYELIPDSEVIKTIGTYRLDPSSEITLKPGKSETIHFYIALEKNVIGRISIPLNITSGKEETIITVTARGIATNQTQNTDWLSQVLKVAFYTLLALIIIVLILAIFKRKNKDNQEKKKGEKEDSSEIETYY